MLQTGTNLEDQMEDLSMSSLPTKGNNIEENALIESDLVENDTVETVPTTEDIQVADLKLSSKAGAGPIPHEHDIEKTDVSVPVSATKEIVTEADIEKEVSAENISPLIPFNREEYEAAQVNEEDTTTAIMGGVKQALGETVGVVKGVKNSLIDLPNNLPTIIGGTDVAGEFISDWAKHWKNLGVDFVREEVFDLQKKYSLSSSPQEFNLRTNPTADAYELLYKTKFKEILGKNWIEEWEKNFRTPDGERNRGWVDKSIYWTSTFIGELGALPISLTSRARAIADLPADKAIDYFYGLVKGGKPLSSITNPEIKKAVSKLMMTATKGLPLKSLSVRDKTFTILRQAGYHMKDALDYGLAAGLFTGAAYGAMTKVLDYTEEEADAVAPFFGIFGMFTGTRPFAMLGKKIFVKTFSDIPTPFRLDGEKVRIGDIAISGFKIRHLLKVQRFQKEGNYKKANYHMLKYSGASEKEAKQLSGNSDEAQVYLKDKVSKQMIEDAVTFTSMLQKLASTHPEYYNYISQAKDRAIVMQSRFKDIFVNDPAQRQKMKAVFEADFRQRNKMTKAYTEDELATIIDNFDVHDTEMVLDQLYMVEFISGIRNMALSSTSLKTFTMKDSIDLYTEGFHYNQALLGQIDLIKSALKSLRSVSDISESSVDFLNKIDNVYASYSDDALLAQRTIKEKMSQAVTGTIQKADTIYLKTIDDLAKRPQEVNNGKSITETEEALFGKLLDIAQTNKADTVKVFSNQYEKVYRDIEIPDKTPPAEAAKMLEEAPLINIDASNLMVHLDRIVDDNLLPNTIGNVGKSTTQIITGGSKLDNFKANLRLQGIVEQFSIDDLASSSISEIENLAKSLNFRTEGVYTNIKELDPNYFVNNKNILDITSPDSNPIKKILNNIEEYVDEEAFKTALIRAIQEQVRGVAKLKGSDSTINAQNVDEILNVFAKPTISIKDTHIIAKGLFKTARESSDLSKKGQNNTLGYAFINSLDAASDTAIASPSKIAEIKRISSDFKEALPDVYDLGVGKQFISHTTKVRGTNNPVTLRKTFEKFLTNGDVLLSVRQFNKMFPDTATGNRKEAENILRYTLGRYLQGTGELNKLGGGDFQAFKDSFRKIIDEDTMTKLEASLNIQTKRHGETFGEEIKRVHEDFKNAFGSLTSASKEALETSLIGQFKLGKGSLSPEKVVDMLFEGQAGRRILRPNNKTSLLDERVVRDTTNKVNINSDDVEELLQTSLVPVVDKGPWAKSKLNGEVISILLEANPAFKEPLKNLILQKFIDDAFVTTTTKGFDKKANALTLAEDLDIATFSNIFKNNLDSLDKLFSEDELVALNTLFESGVIAAGKNATKRVLNVMTEPTTQSRASRLFALQRQVVGMPYLATEQSVMAFQREKAAFLKRMVLDPDFAKLMLITSVEGNVTRSNSLKYIQYLRVQYGEAIEDYDAPDLTKALLKEYDTYNNVENQNKNIDIGLTAKDTETFSLQTLLNIRKEVKEKYGLNVIMPMLMATSPYLIAGSMGQLTPIERKKLNEEANVSRLLGEMRANKVKRQNIKEELIGSQGTY